MCVCVYSVAVSDLSFFSSDSDLGGELRPKEGNEEEADDEDEEEEGGGE